MAQWTSDELSRIGSAEELQVATARADGTLRPYMTIWVVRVGDGLYIRSAHGADNPWYRRALAGGEGHIRANRIERDVTFTAAAPDVNTAVDAAYHAEYDRYGPKIVGGVVGPAAAALTLQLLPR
jgi:hypothetical protein